MSFSKDEFVQQVNAVQHTVHAVAIDKGWWDSPPSVGDLLSLIHSEISEALEAYRVGNPPSKKIPEFNCAEEELADAIIRILDMSEAHGLRIAEAILAKTDYNVTRPFKHGNKLF